jgi:hypothetical protein
LPWQAYLLVPQPSRGQCRSIRRLHLTTRFPSGFWTAVDPSSNKSVIASAAQSVLQVQWLECGIYQRWLQCELRHGRCDQKFARRRSCSGLLDVHSRPRQVSSGGCAGANLYRHQFAHDRVLDTARFPALVRWGVGFSRGDVVGVVPFAPATTELAQPFYHRPMSSESFGFAIAA